MLRARTDPRAADGARAAVDPDVPRRLFTSTLLCFPFGGPAHHAAEESSTILDWALLATHAEQQANGAFAILGAGVENLPKADVVDNDGRSVNKITFTVPTLIVPPTQQGELGVVAHLQFRITLLTFGPTRSPCTPTRRP